jgi:mannose-6-phosphate isomerase-like protein (cupin superfamily)
MTTKINLNEKFGLVAELWRPKVIAALNGQEIKIIKVMGQFPWHHHEHEDELFLVWKGNFRVEFRDHVVSMEPGECLVVPRGIEHRTCADEVAEVLCFEPKGVLNTGNVNDETFTAPIGAKI